MTGFASSLSHHSFTKGSMLASTMMWPRGGRQRLSAFVATRGFMGGPMGSGSRKAKVALIGSGRMGAIRASILRSNPRFDFLGVVDTNQDGAASLADKYGVKAYSALEDALYEGLDGIVMSSPTHTHGEIIQQAAQSGVSVFTEKPVGENAQHIEELFGIALAANIHLCCGFQRRFDPSYVAAAQAIAEGQVGTPVVANIFFADHPAPPKAFMLAGGDIFLDLCAHDVDFITNALQDDIVSVYATGTSMDPELQQAGIHDNAIMVMNFRRGAVATLFMSRSATYGYDQRCEVFGDNGLISVQNQPETNTILSNAHGIQHSKLKHSFPERFAEAFALELNAFAETLLDDKPWPVTGEQCIKVQRVADAARESCLQGKLVEIDYSDAAGENQEQEAIV